MSDKAMIHADAAPGELSPGGARLQDFLDGLPDEANWIAHDHIVWQTGQKNGASGVGPESHTHSSAFTAAVALYLDIYLIRPPYHGQKFLSNAQVDWLNGGRSRGRRRLTRAGGCSARAGRGVLDNAVAAANAGKLVFAGYRQPDVRDPVTGKLQEKSGHTVIVRPQTEPVSASEGPLVEMAGNRNRRLIHMASAFHSHVGAWPEHIELFVHDTDLEAEFAPATSTD